MNAIPSGPLRPPLPSRSVVWLAVMHGLWHTIFAWAQTISNNPPWTSIYCPSWWIYTPPSRMTQREDTRNAAGDVFLTLEQKWIHKNCPLNITIRIISTLFSTFTKLEKESACKKKKDSSLRIVMLCPCLRRKTLQFPHSCLRVIEFFINFSQFYFKFIKTARIA